MQCQSMKTGRISEAKAALDSYKRKTWKIVSQREAGFWLWIFQHHALLKRSGHLTQIRSASCRVKKTDREKVSTSSHTRQCMPQRNRTLTWKSLPSQTRSWNWPWRGRTVLQQRGKSGLWQFSGALSWSSAWWDTRECRRCCCPELLTRLCLAKVCARTGLLFPLGLPITTCTPCLPAFPDSLHTDPISQAR